MYRLGIMRDARHALRMLFRTPAFSADRGHDLRGRHRRQHGGLQRGRRRAAAPAALPRRRPHHDGLARQHAREDQGRHHLLSELPRLARSELVVRAPRRVFRVRVRARPAPANRSACSARRSPSNFFDVMGITPAAGRLFTHRERSRRAGRRHRDLARTLAAPVRRRERRHRPHHHPERRPARNHRRHAARVELAGACGAVEAAGAAAEAARSARLVLAAGHRAAEARVSASSRPRPRWRHLGADRADLSRQSRLWRQRRVAARSTRRQHRASAGDPDGVGRLRAADRLRQPRQPDAGPDRRAAARACRAHRARRRSRAAGPTDRDRGARPGD